MEALLVLFVGVLGTSVWMSNNRVTVEGCKYQVEDKSTDYLKEIESGCFNL